MPDFAAFVERLIHDDQSLAHLRTAGRAANPERLVCPDCGHGRGWDSFRSVAKAGYGHTAVPTGGGKLAVQAFPWLHTFIGNVKRVLLGTYHSVSPRHLDRYLAAFSYRANRRWMEASHFDGLVAAAAVDAKLSTFNDLTTGARLRLRTPVFTPKQSNDPVRTPANTYNGT